MNTQTLRHVPWTCRWGHFGGPVAPAGLTPGFLFWVCALPQDPPGPRALDLDTCENCPYWESTTGLQPPAGRATGEPGCRIDQ